MSTFTDICPNINRYNSYSTSYNIVIDIETGGVDVRNNKPLIYTISAVTLKPLDSQASFVQHIDSVFHVALEKQDSLNRGFVIEPEVEEWFSKLPEEVQKSFQEEAIPVDLGIAKFLEYIISVYQKVSDKSCCYLWGNAPTFDLGCIQHYLTHLGIPELWSHFQERDFRTLIGSFVSEDREAAATRRVLKDLTNKIFKCENDMDHSSLWDAMYEASHLYRLFRRCEYVDTVDKYKQYLDVNNFV